MTFKEAAALLRVDPSTLRKQAHRKRLRATRKGRDWHVTRGEVERYRREVSRKGKTEPLTTRAGAPPYFGGCRNQPFFLP